MSIFIVALLDELEKIAQQVQDPTKGMLEEHYKQEEKRTGGFRSGSYTARTLQQSAQPMKVNPPPMPGPPKTVKPPKPPSVVTTSQVPGKRQSQ